MNIEEFGTGPIPDVSMYWQFQEMVGFICFQKTYAPTDGGTEVQAKLSDAWHNWLYFGGVNLWADMRTRSKFEHFMYSTGVPPFESTTVPW